MDSYNAIYQLKFQGWGMMRGPLCRQHEGQLSLNVSCDALGMDDETTGHVVLPGRRAYVSKVRGSISGQSDSEGQCK